MCAISVVIFGKHTTHCQFNALASFIKEKAFCFEIRLYQGLLPKLKLLCQAIDFDSSFYSFKVCFGFFESFNYDAEIFDLFRRKQLCQSRGKTFTWSIAVEKFSRGHSGKKTPTWLCSRVLLRAIELAIPTEDPVSSGLFGRDKCGFWPLCLKNDGYFFRPKTFFEVIFQMLMRKWRPNWGQQNTFHQSAVLALKAEIRPCSFVCLWQPNSLTLTPSFSAGKGHSKARRWPSQKVRPGLGLCVFCCCRACPIIYRKLNYYRGAVWLETLVIHRGRNDLTKAPCG